MGREEGCGSSSSTVKVSFGRTSKGWDGFRVMGRRWAMVSVVGFGLEGRFEGALWLRRLVLGDRACSRNLGIYTNLLLRGGGKVSVEFSSLV
jgi:hypothetical protein